MAEEKKIKVLIADDHPVVLEGLALMLKQSVEISVVGFARNETELLAKSKQLLPDVIILDVLMPNSNALSSIKTLKAKYPRTGIICCSSVTERELVVDLVNAGINGYIMKSTTIAELREALLKVAKGEDYFTQEITSILVSAMRNKPVPGGDNDVAGLFTDKELEIIRLICQEKTTKEISDLLNINIRTLESAKLRIMKKMGIRNIAGAVYYALKNKLIDISHLNA